jgi:translation initiation factor 4A
LEGIKQFYINVDVIFCNSRRKVDWLTDQLRAKDFTVSSTHGDFDSKEREVILNEFRTGKSTIYEFPAN